MTLELFRRSLLTDGHLQIVPKVQPTDVGLGMRRGDDAHTCDGSPHYNDCQGEESHESNLLSQPQLHIPEHDDRNGDD